MLDFILAVLQQISTWLQEHEAQTNALRNLATAVGIFVGGSFALYKFAFEGAFSRRLQPAASVFVVVNGGEIFMRAIVAVENISSKKVKLNQNLTRVSVSFAPRGGQDWTPPETTPVLEEQAHEVIAPGESVADQLWGKVVDEDYVAARLEFYVTSAKSKIFGRSTTWMHREIVSLVEERGRLPP